MPLLRCQSLLWRGKTLSGLKLAPNGWRIIALVRRLNLRFSRSITQPQGRGQLAFVSNDGALQVRSGCGVGLVFWFERRFGMRTMSGICLQFSIA